ncbi:MAG TPA: BglG family transcription antiterminator [Bacillus sp. (in: firmicutes)]|uniref:BglG family transcription antiterminator n=1 Tax=Bacillus litorisediminis TaxID=2922713 RepID=UPI001FABB9DD|nr:BglG family transcription antiterminator [Bacillus litorisediminis]HWO76193.1 BglG family transcription antiterminator [Bacillus sp. (in: firmicutes)]
MSLDKRSIAILSYLVDAKSYVSVKELMEKFKISRRTIYYDIEKVNGWLKENKLEPVKHVRGEGFKLEEHTSLQIPEKIELFRTWQYEYSAKERKAWIALYLLGSDTSFYLDDLMERTRVSRNTTLDDLKVLKEEIERFHLSLEFNRKTGYTIIGAEDEKRKAIVYYLSRVLPNEGWQTLLAKIPFILNRTDTNLEDHADLFSAEEMKAVQQIVAESEKDLHIQFTDEFFYSLTLRLMFFARRLTQGKKVKINEVEKEVLSETKEYQAANRLSKKLSIVLNVDFPEDEIFYITKHLLSSRVQFSERLSSEWEKSETQILAEVVSNMVTDFQKYACVFFKDKELLEKNLLVHIKPSFYRIKYGLEVENQIAESLKEKYPDIFLLTKKVIHHLEKVVGKRVHENEIALIAMYFGGWMRRTGVKPANRKKVIIVCASGLGTSKLLESQLEGLFSTIDIIGSVSLREYEKNDYNVDFIFSTTPVQKKNKPVFIVSPILTDAEKESLLKKVNALLDTNVLQKQNSVDALMEIIKKHATISDQANLEKELRQYLTKPKSKLQAAAKPSLQNLLQREMIQLEKEVTDWQEAIRVGAIPLLKTNHILENYVDAMIDSVIKNGPYIVVAPKVAIPHANPEDGVKKLGMSLLCLEKGVRFSDSPKHDVQVMIVLAPIDGETHLTALSQLTKMFSEPENLKEIIQCRSVERILEIIEAYSN